MLVLCALFIAHIDNNYNESKFNLFPELSMGITSCIGFVALQFVLCNSLYFRCSLPISFDDFKKSLQHITGILERGLEKVLEEWNPRKWAREGDGGVESWKGG